jgi:hypothetical protein
MSVDQLLKSVFSPLTKKFQKVRVGEVGFSTKAGLKMNLTHHTYTQQKI